MDRLAVDPAGTASFNTGTNKLVLAGVTNLSINSATTIGAGGSLEVDNGTISNVDGSAGNVADTFDVGNGTTTGTLTLLGTNILPQVTVNPGSTLLAGNITGNVTNSGTLGTLGTRAAPAPLLISGTLTSTSTLLVHSNSVTADSFGSSGNPLTSATLSGKVSVTGAGSITNVPIVYTTGGVTATLGAAPGDLTTNPPTSLFSSTLSFNLGHTELLLSTHQSTLSSFAQTPNEAAVAGSLDLIINSGTLPPAFAPVLATINILTPSQIAAALEELSPESLQYARVIAFENSTFLVQRMNGVDADLRGGYGGLDTNAISVVTPGFNTGLGRSLGSFLAYDSPAFHQAAPNGVNYYPGGGNIPTSSSLSSSSGTSHSSSSSSSSPSPSSSETWDPSSQVITDSPNPYMATRKPSGPETPSMSEFIGGDVILADLNQNQSAANAPSSKASYTAGDATAVGVVACTVNASGRNAIDGLARQSVAEFVA